METLFGARLTEWARAQRAPLALVTPACEVGFAELAQRVDRCAGWLLHEGLGPADRIGITIADEFTHLVITLALLRLGIPQVCLPSYDPLSARIQLARRLALTRIVVADTRYALPGHSMLTLLPEPDMEHAWADGCAALAADPDAPAIYFTSSGTTGAARIVASSQRILAQRAEHKGLRPDERVLQLTTVEDYPAKTLRLACVYMGRTSVFQPAASSPIPVHDVCARLAVTRLDLAVLQATDLAPDGVHRRFAPGVQVFASGSRVPRPLQAAFRRSGTPLFIDYGAREAGSIANSINAACEAGPVESVGPPRAWVELEVVDSAGNPLPRGEAGEIRVRSTDMVGGYVDDAEATGRQFRDGWFHPGDVGTLTDDGELCVHGRLDDMMNLNSIKIFPAEIERVLEEHSAVKAAAAFAVSSAVHGDIPVAAVELRDQGGAAVDELMLHARERLGVRAPRRIVVLSALPRNATGKIIKRDLVGAFGPGG